MKKLIAIVFAVSLIAPQSSYANETIKDIEKERQRLYKVSIGKLESESLDSGWIWVKTNFEYRGIYEDCLENEIGKTTKFTSLITGKKVSVTCKDLKAMGFRYVDKTYQAISGSGKCWVDGYTKSNGTKVNGYYRKCRS